jgi:cold-inducible RNA-binding protein
MSTKLFVGSLAWGTTNDSLTAHFAQAGSVTNAYVVTDRMSGRSRGFGFVEMASEEDAQKAVQELHGSTLDGRQINVNEAREQSERPRRSGGAGGGYGGGNRGGFRGGDRRDSYGGGDRRDSYGSGDSNYGSY